MESTFCVTSAYAARDIPRSVGAWLETSGVSLYSDYGCLWNCLNGFARVESCDERDDVTQDQRFLVVNEPRAVVKGKLGWIPFWSGRGFLQLLQPRRLYHGTCPCLSSVDQYETDKQRPS